MADIFISYSSEDRQRIIPVVKALEAQGWSVWWDRIIPPGKTFSRVIEEALAAARCLIVLWTETSVASDWVNNEAAEGARMKILIPALLDEVEIPFEFKRIQAANLVGWRGQSDHPGFQQLVKAVADLLGPPAATVPDAEAPETTPAELTPLELSANTPPKSPPGSSAPQPAIAPPPRKISAAWITILIALAVTVAAGTVVLLKTDLFQADRKHLEDSVARSRLDVATPAVKPEPVVDASGRTPAEPRLEAPPSETEVATAPIESEPEKSARPAPEEPKPETPAYTAGLSTPPTRPEPEKAVQPAFKQPKPGAPPPDLKPSPEAVKPRPPKPARAVDGETPAAGATPDSKALAAQIKPAEPAAARPREAAPRKTITNSIGMEFVLIPASAAAFTMGSRLGIEELIRRFGGSEALYKNERPFHPVRIQRPFYLLATPVTQGQGQRRMETNPSSFKDCGEDCPVETVSWEDAQAFIARLNQMESAAGYRLPSEAEWEYAARAGTESEFFFGDDAVRLGEFAWYSVNSGDRTHPVGQKKSNSWGLYDMSGNVWEWVEDEWHASYDGAPADGPAWADKQRGGARVVRGGDWGVIARYCRSAARYYANATARNAHMGFRLVRSAVQAP